MFIHSNENGGVRILREEEKVRGENGGGKVLSKSTTKKCGSVPEAIRRSSLEGVSVGLARHRAESALRVWRMMSAAVKMFLHCYYVLLLVDIVTTETISTYGGSVLGRVAYYTVGTRRRSHK